MPLNLYGYKTFGINFEFFVWFCIPLNLHGYKTVGIYDNLVIGFVYLLIYIL